MDRFYTLNVYDECDDDDIDVMMASGSSHRLTSLRHSIHSVHTGFEIVITKSSNHIRSMYKKMLDAFVKQVDWLELDFVRDRSRM